MAAVLANEIAQVEAEIPLPLDCPYTHSEGNDPITRLKNQYVAAYTTHKHYWDSYYHETQRPFHKKDESWLKKVRQARDKCVHRQQQCDVLQQQISQAEQARLAAALAEPPKIQPQHVHKTDSTEAHIWEQLGHKDIVAFLRTQTGTGPHLAPPGSVPHNVVKDLFYEGGLAADYELKEIRLVDNKNLQVALQAQLHSIENRRLHAGIISNSNFSSLDADKPKVLQFLKTKVKLPPGYTKAGLIFSWVGKSKNILDSICNNGFLNIRGLDAGFFGSGVYSALEARYTLEYTKTDLEATGECWIMLCAACPGLCYPISHQTDYPHPTIEGFSKFYSGDNNHPIGLFGGSWVSSHLAPVAKVDDTVWYQTPKEYKPDMVEYHELVVRDESQLCPLAMVKLGKLPS
eukprot:TRINITY_DN76313_c0_g1_i1.p1 TRINITY_DN76313_c0_g1~~TRINITY_DN76313_c0_g1_i1.p1  ORF type:complete len:456 (-),score=36.49 TRINITY_DN76313_c0_g1_i1:65-1273(-)